VDYFDWVRVNDVVDSGAEDAPYTVIT